MAVALGAGVVEATTCFFSLAIAVTEDLFRRPTNSLLSVLGKLLSVLACCQSSMNRSITFQQDNYPINFLVIQRKFFLNFQKNDILA